MITTRFVIGDEVYFLSQNRIKKAKIQRMTVEIDAVSTKTKMFLGTLCPARSLPDTKRMCTPRQMSW